jgi:ABC-type multidrug transport system fused ATPase/permease subunit
MKSRSNFIRFLGFLRPHRWRLIGLICFSGVFALTGIPSVMVTRYILVELQAKIERGEYQQAFHVGIICILIAIGIQTADLFLGFFRTMLMLRVGERLVFDIRQKLYRHIQRLSLRYYEGVQTGGIMSRVLWDVEGIRQVSTGALSQFVVDSVVLVVFSIYLFIKCWPIGLVACVFLPMYLVNYLIFRSKIRDASIEVRDKFTAITSELQERVAGVRVVKSFGTERREARSFVAEARENLTLSLRLGSWSAAFGHTAALITIFGTQLVTLLVIWMASSAHTDMKVADIVVYQWLLGRMYGPIINMTNVNDAIMRASACIDRIFATLDSIPDVEEAVDAIVPTDVRGEVAFDGVYFAYEPDELVLKNVSFVAKPGTVTALVGQSGGGKSTLINLIPRFYDPISGVVTLDGVDLKKLKLSALRNHIGIVLQETYLFSGTIRENIMYGRSDASEAEVEAAARAANAHDFILEFRDGYDEEVGERGLKLSGGQKQRIAIARAILRNPKILILDEATSALDSESEHLIQQALENLMENRTTFAIAHRLSTVMNADQILVVENGEVIERGRHAELVHQAGRYAHLAEIQFKAPTLADEEARHEYERENRDEDEV